MWHSVAPPPGGALAPIGGLSADCRRIPRRGGCRSPSRAPLVVAASPTVSASPSADRSRFPNGAFCRHRDRAFHIPTGHRTARSDTGLRSVWTWVFSFCTGLIERLTGPARPTPPSRPTQRPPGSPSERSCFLCVSYRPPQASILAINESANAIAQAMPASGITSQAVVNKELNRLWGEP